MPLPHFPNTHYNLFFYEIRNKKRIKVIKQIIRHIRINKIKQIINENQKWFCK